MGYDVPPNDSDPTGEANLIIPLCRQALRAGLPNLNRIPGDGAAVFCSLCPQLQHRHITLSSLPHAVNLVHDHTVEQLPVQNQNTRQTNQLIPTMTITTMLTFSLARRLTLLLVEGSFLETMLPLKISRSSCHKPVPQETFSPVYPHTLRPLSL